MNADLRRPPAAAVWLLRNLCSKTYAESLGGDLLERFHQGQSEGWFWRRVAIAILVSASWDWHLKSAIFRFGFQRTMDFVPSLIAACLGFRPGRRRDPLLSHEAH
jgi:hypothetical protein